MVRIQLAPHSPDWAARFERERDRLRHVLGDTAVAIDHFGSTSVAGLSAKPIVDILVARAPTARFDAWAAALRPLGYVHAREDSTDQSEGQWFFRDEPRTVHVHVYEAETRAHRRHLAFRDALRANPRLREEYEALKRALAQREWSDVQAYADAKTDFVRRVEREALAS